MGPIARELVAGHPALERVVRDHLASRDEVLLRRWGVAWRYTPAFAARLAAGLGLLLWAAQHPEFGDAVTALLRRVDWDGVVGAVCSPCRAFAGNPMPPLSQNPAVEQLGQYARGQAVTYLLTHYLTVQAIVVGILAGAVMALTSAPGATPEVDLPGALRLGGLCAVCAIGIAFVFLASLIFSGYVHQHVKFAAVPDDPHVLAFVWPLGIGEVLYSVSVVATVLATLQRRQWGWLLGVLLGLTLLTTFDYFYRTLLLAVAVVGCSFTCWAARPRGAGGKIALAAVALLGANASIGVTLFDAGVVTTPLLGAGVFVEYLLPPRGDEVAERGLRPQDAAGIDGRQRAGPRAIDQHAVDERIHVEEPVAQDGDGDGQRDEQGGGARQGSGGELVGRARHSTVPAIWCAYLRQQTIGAHGRERGPEWPEVRIRNGVRNAGGTRIGYTDDESSRRMAPLAASNWKAEISCRRS